MWNPSVTILVSWLVGRQARSVTLAWGHGGHWSLAYAGSKVLHTENGGMDYG